MIIDFLNISLLNFLDLFLHLKRVHFLKPINLWDSLAKEPHKRCVLFLSHIELAKFLVQLDGEYFKSKMLRVILNRKICI